MTSSSTTMRGPRRNRRAVRRDFGDSLKPMPYRELLNYITRPDREGFPEYIIISWAVVEQNIDIALLADFNLLSYVPSKPKAAKDDDSIEGKLKEVLEQKKESKQIDLLLELPFYKKMDYLMKVKTIDRRDHAILSKFRTDRNRSFHGAIWGPRILQLSDEKKTSIADRAEKAVDASYRVMSRCLRKPNPKLR